MYIFKMGKKKKKNQRFDKHLLILEFYVALVVKM